MVRDAAVHIGGVAPSTTSGVKSPSLGERTFDVAGRERWTASAAHAAWVWEVASAPDAIVELSLVADVRQAGEAAPALSVERVPGGLRISRGDGPTLELLLACGEAIDAAGPRVAARGRGTVRLIAVAGANAADLARARDRIERRGLAAIGGERAQHARLLADYGTAIESDDPSDAAAFEWAKVAADGLLVELPGRGPFVAAAYREPGTSGWEADGPIVWAAGDALASLGGALLAAGLREAARDALRSPGGALLADVYHSWTGEPAPPVPPSATGAPPSNTGASVVGPARDAVWAPILREVDARWGARPVGGAALALRPMVPRDRRHLGVRRLRVGTTVIDVELRRRFDRVAARLHRRHGPPLPVDVELDGPPPMAVTADGEALPGARAVVVVSDRHEVLFQF